jgi:hypothetical protein
MVVISPLDLRPTRMIVRLTREGRINLEFAMVPIRNSDRDSACNQCERDLHIVATRVRRAIPRYPRAQRVQINH